MKKQQRRKQQPTPTPAALPAALGNETVRRAALRALLHEVTDYDPPTDSPRALHLGKMKTAQAFAHLLVEGVGRCGILSALTITNAEYVEALVDLCKGSEVDWSVGEARVA